MKILFGTVVYPEMEKYLSDFLHSIETQTYKKFDLLIVNDGIEINNLQENIRNYRINYSIINNSKKLKPVFLRKEIIDYAIHNEYELLIFGDSDDVFSIDRVENILKVHDKNIGFYYNSLIVQDTGVDFFKGKLPSCILSETDIESYNFLGMSNTAINLKKSKEILKDLHVNSKCKIFDWYLYSFLLLNKLQGKYVNNAKTFYRIYNNNIAGYTNLLDLNKLEFGIKTKIIHYEMLSKLDIKYLNNLYLVKELKDTLDTRVKKIKYIEYINENYKNSVFWWENIRTLDKLGGVNL